MHPAHGSDRPHDIWPPGEVGQVTGMYLDLVDEAAPGLVEGLYLRGSLGFGEWYDGRSDVDFAAVTAERPRSSSCVCSGTCTCGWERPSPGPRSTGST